MVERMLKHALPPLVEAGNRAALEALAAKAGTDSPTLLHNYGHTIIAKCLYEGEALPSCCCGLFWWNHWEHLTCPCR